jgi:hypothetical protein
MYQLTWEASGGLLRTYSGTVGWAEMNESIAKVHGDPRYEDLRYVINDFTQCDSLDITRDQLEDIAARVSGAEYSHKQRKILKHFRTAYVVTTPTVRDTVVAFFEAIIVDTPVNIFETLPEARAWIQLGK